jgi:hypothetical protein
VIRHAIFFGKKYKLIKLEYREVENCISARSGDGSGGISEERSTQSIYSNHIKIFILCDFLVK